MNGDALVRWVTLFVLASTALATLPPGYEDEAYCPPGSCLRDVRRPSGALGAASGGTECFNPSSNVVTDEIWTGSLTDTQPPAGWVRVLSNLDASFETQRCGFEHMHGLPDLPNKYETWVTCNIINKNYTVVVHEIYDQPGNRALFRRFHADDGDTTSLYLYDFGEYFHVNSSGCTMGPMSELTRGFMQGSSSTRIIGTHEMFNFAAEGQVETYMGMVDVAGVPCDLWRSATDEGPMGIQQTIDYYFSAPGWRWPSAHASQVPVMLNVTGSRPNGPPGTPRYHYSHIYEFGHFTVGLERYVGGWSENHTFVIPRSAGECVGNISDARNIPYSTASEHSSPTCEAQPGDAGVTVGVAVALCVTSVLMGVAVTCLLMRGRGKAPKPTVRTLDIGQPSYNVGGVSGEAAGVEAINVTTKPSA